MVGRRAQCAGLRRGKQGEPEEQEASQWREAGVWRRSIGPNGPAKQWDPWKDCKLWTNIIRLGLFKHL